MATLVWLKTTSAGRTARGAHGTHHIGSAVVHSRAHAALARASSTSAPRPAMVQNRSVLHLSRVEPDAELLLDPDQHLHNAQRVEQIQGHVILVEQLLHGSAAEPAVLSK